MSTNQLIEEMRRLSLEDAANIQAEEDAAIIAAGKKVKKVKKYEHTDIFGNELDIGSAVAFCNKNTFKIGFVVSLGQKMIRVMPILQQHKSYSWREYKGDLTYPDATIKVDDASATFYVLKNGVRTIQK